MDIRNFGRTMSDRPKTVGLVTAAIVALGVVAARKTGFETAAAWIAALGVMILFLALVAASNGEFSWNRSYDQHRECWVEHSSPLTRWVTDFLIGYAPAIFGIIVIAMLM